MTGYDSTDTSFGFITHLRYSLIFVTSEQLRNITRFFTPRRKTWDLTAENKNFQNPLPEAAWTGEQELAVAKLASGRSAQGGLCSTPGLL